jgi:hypothetical protein
MENRYGIEIELENCRRLDRFGFPPMWVVEGDGSLRNAGMEFKSARDYSLSDVKTSLSYLHSFFEGNEIDVEANPRCGVHVHMDVRDMSHAQVYNLLCNYSMIEPTFFAYVNSFGEDREGSHFCVPYYHVRDRAASLMMAFKDYNLDNIQHYGRKYMALNVLPYLRFGSVEWRQFPAILPVTSIVQWLDILDKFKERSKLGVFSEEEVQPWLDEVFPHLSSEDRIDTGLETYYYHTLPEREEASIVRPTGRPTTLRDIDEIFGASPDFVWQPPPRAEEVDFGDEDVEPMYMPDDEEEPEDEEEGQVELDMELVNQIPEELRFFAVTHGWMETMRHPLWHTMSFRHRMQLLRWRELERGTQPE